MALMFWPGPAGVSMQVRVQPGTGTSAVVGERGGILMVKVRAKPEDGEATAECLRVVAEAMGVAQSFVTLVRGQRSRMKIVRVAGLTAADMQARFNESSK